MLSGVGSMFKFICIFFPTFLSINVLREKNSIQDIYDGIIKYCIYNSIISTIMLLIVHIYVGFTPKIITNDFFTVSFCFKYLIISLFLSYILPNIYIYIKKNEIIKIEVKDYDENQTKHKKKKSKN